MLVYCVGVAGLLIFTSWVIFLCEHPVQPDVFSSVLASLWFAANVLTLAGNGSMLPETTAGRLFTSCLAFTTIGFFSLPGIFHACMHVYVRMPMRIYVCTCTYV